MEARRHGGAEKNRARQVLYNEFVTNRVRYWTSLSASALVLGVINYFDFTQPTGISDKLYRFGLPFAIFEKGGFLHVRRYLWVGLMADLLVLLAFTAALSWTWHRLSSRHPNQWSHEV
jgi:predicted permease